MAKYNEYDLNKIVYFDTPQEAIKNADICFIFTEWPEVKAMQPAEFKTMAQPLVLDGRNCFSVRDMEEANVNYVSVGRSAVEN